MDEITNLKAFTMVARTSSFAKAARELDISPSVITKRIDQLEWRLRTKLFNRTTREVSLTSDGERYLNRVRNLIFEFDEIMNSMTKKSDSLIGKIRIKAPTTLTIYHLGRILNKFQNIYPDIQIDLELLDRNVNPIEEGFDIAISGFPPTFDGVIDIPLCKFGRIVCASPEYLARKGYPKHPRELVRHDTLCYKATGTIWTFESERGPISVSLQPKLIANEGQVLCTAAVEGHGIIMISSYILAQDLQVGRLEPLLLEYPIPDMWFKATVPEKVYDSPIVRILLEWLQKEFSLNL